MHDCTHAETGYKSSVEMELGQALGVHGDAMDYAAVEVGNQYCAVEAAAHYAYWCGCHLHNNSALTKPV